MSDQQQDAAANPFETAREELASGGIPSVGATESPTPDKGIYPAYSPPNVLTASEGRVP